MVEKIEKVKKTETKEFRPVSPDTLLSVQDLHVWFELRKFGFGHAGYVRAVDNVSFDLKRKETIALVGESGCGKSSLMKTILGINVPTKGDILYEGRPMTSFSRKELNWYRSKVGYVQQDPYGALAPFMNIKSIMEEPMIVQGIKNKKERLERIHKAFEEVKLTPVDEFLPKYPHMLSGGQQQRVVIARAMILNPTLLVADEPVSMLDASVRVEILKLLRGLQEAHELAVIYITHDLSTVRYFSERIFVMYAGELVEKANVDELVMNAQHPYTHALLAATSDPDAKNVDEFQDVPPGEPPSLVKPPSGCRFHPRCPKMIPGLCEIKEPPEFEQVKDHYVHCWLYE
jgi:peptide/nickel transport system ATP-binding protein